MGMRMEPDDLEEIARLAYDAIFNDMQEIEHDSMIYEMGRTSSSKLRKFSIKGLNFIEQNPKKDSQWAQKAREGHQIMWVMKGRQYLARVMDGKYLKLK